MTLQVINKRYEVLNQLGSGGMGVVYRVLDRLTGQVLTLKRLLHSSRELEWGATPSERDSPARQLGLVREFSILAGLRHPHIISVLEHGFDEEGQPYFTMDLEENASTICAAAQGQPQALQVHLLEQLLQALAYLHRRGIIHRDLKPDNVLVTRNQVKVLDFGMCLRPRLEPSQPEDDAGGTLAYAAPEVLRGGRSSEASDLWAVGVIAYQMFYGCHPFDASQPQQLLKNVLTGEPQGSDGSIDPALGRVLRMLLEKQPEQRYRSAGEVITALSSVVKLPLAQETVATRESFLQTAALVERDAELGRLTAQLREMLVGRGSAVLVAGESGIGKSRMLDELTIHAMAQRALVLRGQAAPGAGVYHPWRRVLRHLVLISSIRDLEAAVLRPLLPDIEELLGRRIPAIPELETDAAQARFLCAIEQILRSQNQPLVLMIEDLQWAGSESLKLFAFIARLAAELPVLLVGSFRDDEQSQPREELPGIEVLRLARLSESGIVHLSEQILGEGACSADLLNLLARESEGNTFFLIEILRALAEQAGGLAAISTMRLPQQVFAGGVRRLIAQRLQRMTQADHALLQRAAVAGREIDIALLERMSKGGLVLEWLMRCADASLVEIRSGHWRFTHDKLRDGLLAELDGAQRRSLHLDVATALEAGGVSAALAGRLAYHYAEAGEPGRELHYAALAGEAALHGGAYVEAVRLLERALALMPQSTPVLHRASLQRMLGEALFRSGSLDAARHNLTAALGTLGAAVPKSTMSLAMGLAKQVLQQLLHRLWPARFLRRRQTRRMVALEVIPAYLQLSRLGHHLNEGGLVLYVTLCALNLAEAVGLPAEQARLYATLGAVLGLVPAHGLAQAYYRRAHAICGELGQPGLTAHVLAHQGYYEAGLGAWNQMKEHLADAMEKFAQAGDQRMWEESITILGSALFIHGEVQRSLELYRKMYSSAVLRSDRQVMSWGIINETRILFHLEGCMDAEERIARARELLVDQITSTVVDGAALEHYLERGDVQRARSVAEAVLGRPPLRSYMACFTYAKAAETYLWCALQSRPEEGRERRQMLSAARRAGDILSGLARAFPIAKPRVLLIQGLAHLLSGRRARARSCWAAACASARELGTPLEESRGRALLARLEWPPPRLFQLATSHAAGAPDTGNEEAKHG